MKGAMGKVLWVDLSSQKFREENLPEEIYRNFLGGYGLTVKLAWDRQRPGADPLGEDNIFAVAPGLLTGTLAFFSGRYMTSAKSPASGGFGMANSGGTFGPEIKRCGYDAILFTGKAERPMYLLIDGDRKELMDASHLWGKDAIEAEREIRKETGNQRLRVAAIGKGGERLSLISGVVNDGGRIAARMGLGAVMGSKKLKAIALQGNKKVDVHDRDKMVELNRKFLKKYNTRIVKLMVKDPLKSRWGKYLARAGDLTAKLKVLGRVPPIFFRVLLMRYGTPGFGAWSMTSGDSPIKNWSGASQVDFPSRVAKKITDESVLKYQIRKYACSNCPCGCGGIMKVDDGPYPLEETHKTEYETLAAFGAMNLTSDLHAIMKMNDICNREGIDTISAGSVMAFATECFEKGIISEKDVGFKLSWGDSEAQLRLLQKIVERDGIGDLLADGVRRAAERIGKGAEKFAVHAGGIEPAMHDPRADLGYGVSYQCDPAPGKHLYSIVFLDLEQIESKFPTCKKAPALYPKSWRYKNLGMHAERMSYGSVYFHLISAAGLCLFGPLTSGKIIPVFEWINAATGWEYGWEDYYKVGKRILTMMQCFNLREGIKPGDFKLHDRARGIPPLTAGFAKGVTLDMQTLQREFYRSLGWDPESGKPTPETLDELGLGDVKEVIYG